MGHEGGAEYERGIWDPLDLMSVRDAAVADIVPRMSEMECYGDFGNVRLVYNLGHALYEFIEARWGKDGVRQFLFSLRKSAIGGGSSPDEEAFQMTAREFDQQFEKYLKDRFKAFWTRSGRRTTARICPPTRTIHTYTGRSRSSRPRRAISSPSRRETGAIRSSTSSSSRRKTASSSGTSLPASTWTAATNTSRSRAAATWCAWMSWSPVGDRLAYFVRNEKYRTLIIQNVLTGKIDRRFNIHTVDNPESPNFSPDGSSVVFSGLRTATGDIFRLDLQSGEITNLTNDEFADYAPVYSPDGRFIVYLARISGSQKLFRLDLDSGKKTSSRSARRMRPRRSSSTSTR